MAGCLCGKRRRNGDGGRRHPTKLNHAPIISSTEKHTSRGLIAEERLNQRALKPNHHRAFMSFSFSVAKSKIEVSRLKPNFSGPIS